MTTEKLKGFVQKVGNIEGAEDIKIQGFAAIQKQLMLKLEEKTTAAANAATVAMDNSVTNVSKSASMVALPGTPVDPSSMSSGLSEVYMPAGR